MYDSPVILLVEDSEADAFLVRRAFERVGAKHRLEHVKNGEEAINYLAGEGVYADRTLYPVPSLVLLDLKMPLRDGFEVLTWIRGRPELARVPVLVLTLSDRREDIKRAYDSGANSFLVKPMEFEGLLGLIETVKGFWLDRAMVPTLG